MATKEANQIQVGTQLINSDNQLFTITIINGNLIWAATKSANGDDHTTLIQTEKIGVLDYGAWYEIVSQNEYNRLVKMTEKELEQRYQTDFFQKTVLVENEIINFEENPTESIIKDSIQLRWHYKVLLFQLNANFSQSDLVQMAKDNDAEISFYKNVWNEDRAKIWNEIGCLIFKKEGINNYKLGNS